MIILELLYLLNINNINSSKINNYYYRLLLQSDLYNYEQFYVE
jgi:hypothetical protein